MRYYIEYTADGKVYAVGIGPGGTEITREQYETLLGEIEQKNDLTGKLYRGEITQAAVPEDWRAEIAAAVEKIIEEQGAYPGSDIDEALAILSGEVSA